MTSADAPHTRLDVVGIGALTSEHVLLPSEDGVAHRFSVGLHHLLERLGTPVTPGAERHVPEPVMREVLAHAARAGARFEVSLGGSAYNAVRTLAAIDSTARLGYVGVAGQDPVRRCWPHADELRRLGVDTELTTVVPCVLSGVCVAYTAGGRRTLVTTQGANALMAGHLTDPRLLPYLKRARVVHITSLPDQHATHRLLALLRGLKGTAGFPLVVLDPGGVWCSSDSPAIDGLLALSDYVLLNRSELAAVGRSNRGHAAATNVLRKTPPDTVLLVKHPDGTRTYRRSGARVVEARHPHQQLAPEATGDAFAAGILSALGRAPVDLASGIRLGAHLARDALAGRTPATTAATRHTT